MTTMIERPVDNDAPLVAAAADRTDLDNDLAAFGTDPGDLHPTGDADTEETVASSVLLLATVSALLSGFGAAWMVGGMFRGEQGRLVGMLGAVVGAGLVYAATRFRSSILQFAVLPATLLLGAALVAPAAGGGTSSLPALVKDAATSTHILQPPLDFAPGWRLILVVVLGLFTAAGASLGLSLNRPRLAVAVPVPLTVVAALLQPSSSAIVTSAVSVGFVMMALATSYAADGSDGALDAAFEVRRIGRSLVNGIALIVALVLASHLTFLFPNPQQNRTIPPQRPPAGQPQPDVPLFRVTSSVQAPLRLGVIDVYDTKQQTWLLPPYDTNRLHRLGLPAQLEPNRPGASTYQVKVVVEQATGHLLPDVAGSEHADGSGTVDYDPRTQTLSLADRPVFTGLTYTLTATTPPTGAQLTAATGVVPADIAQFLVAPPVPPAVSDLLAKGPNGPYAKVQYLRTALYKHFIAAGDGQPKDVSANRVVQFLAGATGNPYELTAAEALLTRWAGVPARIGYGYYGGAMQSDGSRELRPNNASTYLEAYFAPYGWVPIVGTPPQAQAALSNHQRDTDPNIKASPDLGINVYLPVKNPVGLPLYAYARYYLVRILPIGALGFVLVVTYPLLLKRVRRRRRRAWANAHGVPGRIAVAYAALRDTMIDLGLPGRHSTPLEMLELVEPDEEHEELAWLVTRGLWGDLRDGISGADADNAERLSRSVRNRLVKAQPETARLLAAVSRASLRDPWSRELPNAWRQLRVRIPWRALRRLPARAARLVRVRRGLPAPAGTALLVVVAAMLLGGCAGSTQTTGGAPVPFPTRLIPTSIAGMTVHPEPIADAVYTQGAKDSTVLVSAGQVFSLNGGGLIQGALQVAQLKPGYSSADPEVAKAIAASISLGTGTTTELAPADGRPLYSLDDGSQRIYLWFPTRQAMAILVLKAQIPGGAAEALARSLVGYGDGQPINEQALTAAFASTIGATGASQPPVVAPTPSTPPTSPKTPASP